MYNKQMTKDELNKLGQSPTDEIVYGEPCKLRQGAPDNIRYITRCYPVKTCTVDGCENQIKVKKVYLREYDRWVFPTEARFGLFKTCGDPECRKALSYRLPAPSKDELKRAGGKISPLTGRPIDPKVKNVTVYRCSLGF